MPTIPIGNLIPSQAEPWWPIGNHFCLTFPPIPLAVSLNCCSSLRLMFLVVVILFAAMQVALLLVVAVVVVVWSYSFSRLVAITSLLILVQHLNFR